MRRSRLTVFAVVLVLGGGYETALAVSLGTEFTYQGQLKDGGIPADGDYDFIFRLYDAAEGGAQVGGDFPLDDWPVSNGLFTAQLDFGLSAFDGNARWLEVAVRLGAGGGEPYTVLSPRQPVTATPFALYALAGPGGAGGYWAASGDDIYNTNFGNIGVGTSSPLEQLHVAGPAANLRLQDDDDPASYLVIKDTGAAQAWFAKYAASGCTLMDFTPMPLDGVSEATIRLFRTTNTTGLKRVMFCRGDGTTGTSALIGVDGADSHFQLQGGNFGIGTNSPAEALDVDGTVRMTGFQLTTSPTNGYVLTSDATGAGSWQPSGGGDSLWLTSGDDIYYNGGNVGIGTSSPPSNLHVMEIGSGNPTPPARIGLHWFQPMDLNDWFSMEVGGQGTGTGSSPRLVRESGTALYFQTEDTMNSTLRTTQMTLDPDGKLGLGITDPTALLEAVSDTGVHGIRSTTSAIPVAAYRTSTSGSWPAIHAESASSGSGATGIRSYLTSTSPGSGSAAVYGHISGSSSNGYGVHGNHVGMGTGVYGVSFSGTGVYGESTNGMGVYAKTTNGNYALYAEATGGGLAARFVGNVEILSQSTGQTLIEFGEGLDYAEGFDVCGESEITPGTVLIIDTENAGELAMSNGPYDRKVAGIVAGANGLGSAVRLGAGQYDFDVALAGRVYCNVDASYGAIQPGDLLTTSPTPGYAMKVTDHEKAQGAILGKAMQPLEQGEKSQILVLVTLQ